MVDRAMRCLFVLIAIAGGACSVESAIDHQIGSSVLFGFLCIMFLACYLCLEDF